MAPFGHPRGTRVFSKLQGLQRYFLENFKCNLTNYESENFPESSPDNSLDPRILGLLFSTKNTLTISCPQVIEIPGTSASPNKYFTENIPWVPLTLSKCFISTLHVFGKQRNLEYYLSYKTVLKSGQTKPAFRQLISPK